MNRGWEGPVWFGLFVEHKDLMEIPVSVDVGNPLNARHRLDRTVYLGRRNSNGVDFV